MTASVVLTACGGGSGGGGVGGPPVVSTDTVPVLAAGGDDFAASTAIFPYYYADVDFDRDTVRGIASVEIIDTDTIELVDSETGSTFYLVLDSGTIDDGVFNFVFDLGADGILGTIDDGVSGDSQFEVISRGSGRYSLYLLNDEVDGNGFPRRERLGGFGFETASADMPMSNSVDYVGASVLYIVSDAAGPDDAPYSVFEGSFGFTADFSNKTFDGTAFSGSETVNLDDVGDENDVLSVSIGMSGTIAGNKLDGTVTGDSASVLLNGDSVATPLTLSLSNSDVDGQFYGTDASGVNGTWGAGLTLSDGSDALTGVVTGFFEGDVD